MELCTLCANDPQKYYFGTERICEDCLKVIQDNEKWLYGKIVNAEPPEV